MAAGLYVILVAATHRRRGHRKSPGAIVSTRAGATVMFAQHGQEAEVPGDSPAGCSAAAAGRHRGTMRVDSAMWTWVINGHFTNGPPRLDIAARTWSASRGLRASPAGPVVVGRSDHRAMRPRASIVRRGGQPAVATGCALAIDHAQPMGARRIAGYEATEDRSAIARSARIVAGLIHLIPAARRESACCRR